MAFQLAACAEMLWPKTTQALADKGNEGPVGMEAFAKNKPEDALEAFRAAFIL